MKNQVFKPFGYFLNQRLISSGPYRTTYLPPYKRMIVDTGAYSIMSAYSSYDGVAMITNHHVLTEILREEWGYKCWVTSDSGATDRICDAFKMCKSGDKESITLLVSCHSSRNPSSLTC